MTRSIILAATVMFATASAALAQDNIKIAVLGPMAFAQGENGWAGAEMARDEINKQGGIVVRMILGVVSKDGKTLTNNTVGYNAQGVAFHNVTVFDKQ